MPKIGCQELFLQWILPGVRKSFTVKVFQLVISDFVWGPKPRSTDILWRILNLGWVLIHHVQYSQWVADLASRGNLFTLIGMTTVSKRSEKFRRFRVSSQNSGVFYDFRDLYRLLTGAKYRTTYPLRSKRRVS